MINIVVPMAGLGSRFAKAGYQDPKPLIPVCGVPMIKLVIDNLTPAITHRFIFICQREHVNTYQLAPKLQEWAPGSLLIEIDGLTEGAACTVLAASPYIDNESTLLIANSDQYIDASMDDFLAYADTQLLDGLIMTMQANDAKWSYVGLNDEHFITRVVEKEVISDEATVGIYHFQRGCDFVSGAKEMIARNERVNGEFYVAPVYNALIAQGSRIGIWNIGCESNGMYGLGTPTDLNHFLTLPISQQAMEKSHAYS